MNNLTLTSNLILTSNSIALRNDDFKKFFEYLEVSPKTAATYQRALKQMVKYFAMHGITHATRDNILGWKKSLMENGRKPATIALYLSAARKFFSWLGSDIATGIKSPKIDRGYKKDFFGATQLKTIIGNVNRDTLKGKRDFAILSLLMTCGLRTVEITRANVEDIRILGNNTVLFIQGKGKTDKTEFVKLSRQVNHAIKEYLKARGETKPSEPLFTCISNRNKNGRLTTYSVSQIAKHAMIDAGFNSPRLTAHSFRHSAVTLALMSGATLQEVQSFARHSNISTTTIYAHNVDRIKSICEANISNLIF